MISDIKNPYPLNATPSGAISTWTYLADIRNISNMYPYGKSYPAAATYSADEEHKYSFNGMEDDKNFGEDVLDFGARIFDTEYPVFLSPDPYESKFGYQSTYVFAGDSPIRAIDKNGEHIWIINNQRKTIAVLRFINATDIGNQQLQHYSGNERHLIIFTGDVEYAAEGSDGSKAITLNSDHMKKFVKDGKLDFSHYKKNTEDYENYMVYQEFNSLGGIDLSDLEIDENDKVGLIKLNARDHKGRNQYQDLFKDNGELSVSDLEDLSPTGLHEVLHDVYAIEGKKMSIDKSHEAMGETTGITNLLNKITQSGNPYSSGSVLYQFEEEYESLPIMLIQVILDSYQESNNSSEPTKFDVNEEAK